jgi:hypothetical protein
VTRTLYPSFSTTPPLKADWFRLACDDGIIHTMMHWRGFLVFRQASEHGMLYCAQQHITVYHPHYINLMFSIFSFVAKAVYDDLSIVGNAMPHRLEQD